MSSKNYRLSTQNRASHAMGRSATLASFGVHRQLAQRALRWPRIVHAAADLCCALQQFAGMLPSSDLLFAFPVKSRLVSIPCGHIELLRLGKSACCQVCNPFFYWSLRLGARQIESAPFDLSIAKAHFAGVTVSSSSSSFSIRCSRLLQIREPTSGELFGFDRAAAISDQSAEIIASSAQSFGQRMTSPLSAFYHAASTFA
jgi:hypothetical protein